MRHRKRRITHFVAVLFVLLVTSACNPPSGGVTLSGTISGVNWVIGGPASVVVTAGSLTFSWTGTVAAGPAFAYSVPHVPDGACNVVATFTESTATSSSVYSGSLYSRTPEHKQLLLLRALQETGLLIPCTPWQLTTRRSAAIRSLI